MARLLINNNDFSEKLKEFSLACNKCGSKKVVLDIDWAAYPSDSWCNITVICKDCHEDEVIYEAR